MPKKIAEAMDLGDCGIGRLTDVGVGVVDESTDSGEDQSSELSSNLWVEAEENLGDKSADSRIGVGVGSSDGRERGCIVCGAGQRIKGCVQSVNHLLVALGRHQADRVVWRREKRSAQCVDRFSARTA